MASLKEIKTRIASVKNTLKITSAMKLVASAKLHKAQMAIEGMMPYQTRMEQMVSSLMASVSANGQFRSPLAEVRPVRRVAIVSVSSSASLCGGFNNNLIRLTQHVIDEHTGQGRNLLLIPIGRKVAQAFVPTDTLQMDDTYVQIGEKPLYNEAASLSAHLTDLYLKGDIDCVELLYTHYHNMAVQVLMRKQFLPLEEESVNASKGNYNSPSKLEGVPQRGEGRGWDPSPFILEPSAPELLHRLLPQALAIRLYATLLDSSAAEHAARTFAMQTASDNGDGLLQELNLQYNKVRQQSITNELLDIVGGQMR